MFANTSLQAADPEIWQALQSEKARQHEHIELIASENYTSPIVMQAQGSQMTNKYAEGYPNKRYYGGCEFVDQAELLAIQRGKKLFDANYVNVQPHSGSSANSAAFMALLKPLDKVLGMSLAEGGHLTHGAKVSFSGKMYESVTYGINKEGLIDYDQLEDIAVKEKPKMIIAGFSAYSRFLDWQAFRDISDKVGAVLLADIAHVSGLVAVGLYPSPVPFADVVTTTTHKTLRGPRGGMILSRDEDVAKKINSSVFPGNQGGPLMHVIAAKAISFLEALQPEFTTYQKQVLANAKAMSKRLIEHGYDIVSGGTDNHLMLLNLVKQSLTGKEVDAALGRCNITVNKNAVPNDPQSPFVTSGIRLGTPAITTRGFSVDDSIAVADYIDKVIKNLGSESVEKEVIEQVKLLCDRLPVYP